MGNYPASLLEDFESADGKGFDSKILNSRLDYALIVLPIGHNNGRRRHLAEITDKTKRLLAKLDRHIT